MLGFVEADTAKIVGTMFGPVSAVDAGDLIGSQRIGAINWSAADSEIRAVTGQAPQTAEVDVAANGEVGRSELDGHYVQASHIAVSCRGCVEECRYESLQIQPCVYPR